MALDSELINDFKIECKQLIQELFKVVEIVKASGESTFPTAALAEFAQKIDRIMGTAKTFAGFDPDNAALAKIAKIAEFCKAIGYKASEKKDAKLLKPVALIWTDVLKVIDSLVENLENPENAAKATKMLGMALKERLKWLSERLGIDFKKF